MKLATGLLAPLAVVLAVVAGVLGWQVKDGAAVADRRSAIQAAARQETMNLLNVDYRTAKSSSDKVLSGATGELRDQWGGGGFAQQFIDAITKGQAVSTVKQLNVGVVNMSDKGAEAMVIAQTVVTMPQVPSGTQRPFRISMELQRSGGRWLVSKFGLVP